MVLTLPLPALFVYELGTALLDSLSQTLVDGSSPLIGECLVEFAFFPRV